MSNGERIKALSKRILAQSGRRRGPRQESLNYKPREGAWVVLPPERQRYPNEEVFIEGGQCWATSPSGATVSLGSMAAVFGTTSSKLKETVYRPTPDAMLEGHLTLTGGVTKLRADDVGRGQ